MSGAPQSKIEYRKSNIENFSIMAVSFSESR